MRRTMTILIAFVLLSIPAYSQEAGTRINIINMDGTGEGFNDPTPKAPIGGNPGTTLGEQRLIAFQYAADLWGALIDSPVEIRVEANFDPLECSSDSAVLGSAGPRSVFSNVSGEPIANTWYVSALANKLAGSGSGSWRGGDPGEVQQLPQRQSELRWRIELVLRARQPSGR